MADYVIVGAGAAGCVLADDLSRRGAEVVLLEAGRPDRTIHSKIPAAFTKLFRGAHDWNYWTVPQVELLNRELYWPRGKMLGGSTSINAMIYIRGHRHTFDQWARAGNDGWGYHDLLGLFVELEDQQRGADDFHGVGGPLTVSDLRSPNPLSQAFVDAGAQIGFGYNNDFNGDTQEGFGPYQVTQRNGLRCSAATAFLKPAMSRPNLTVITGAHATRVVIQNGRAVGVDWTNGKSARRLRSSEVILSGGTINSPQLLMLSGIGPASHLNSLGIDVVVDSPNVGQNLIDHPVTGVIFQVRDEITLAHAESFKHVAEFATKRTGMLSSNVAEAGGFVKLGDGEMPDIQYHFAPGAFLDHGFEPVPGDGLSIGATLVDVKSRGSISLVSNDPFAAPLIDPRYLSEERDFGLLVEGAKLARDIAHQSPLAEFLTGEVFPGEMVATDDDWVGHVRRRTESLYHPTSTCAMGPEPTAVVDPKLRVNGVDGLRVADASVMPSIVNGNTQAITMVIGKKAAEFVTE